MKYNEIENLVLNFDEFYENKELDIELFDDILMMDDELIPKERAEALKQLLIPLKIENNKLVDIRWYNIDAARILASWGYKEGLDYLKIIVEFGLENIGNCSPHRLYGYDQTYEEIGDSLMNYVIRFTDRSANSKIEALKEVSPSINKIISRAKNEFVSLGKFICLMYDNNHYEFFSNSLKDTLEYLQNKKNKTFLDEYNIDDISRALTRLNLLEEIYK